MVLAPGRKQGIDVLHLVDNRLYTDPRAFELEREMGLTLRPGAATASRARATSWPRRPNSASFAQASPGDGGAGCPR